jgi:hypothetical protein
MGFVRLQTDEGEHWRTFSDFLSETARLEAMDLA